MKLTVLEESAVLQLYEEDIILCFLGQFDLVECAFGTLVVHNLLAELEKKHSCTKLAIAIEFWKELNNAPTKALLFSRVLQFLCQAKNDDAKLLHKELLALTMLSNHGDVLRLIRYSADLFKVIDQKKVHKTLRLLNRFTDLLDLIETYAEHDAIRWKKVLIRKIFFMSRSLQSDFLYAVSLCSEVAKEVVEKVHPCFSRHYELLVYQRSINIERDIMYVCKPGTPLSQFIYASNNSSDEFKFDIYRQNFAKFSRKRHLPRERNDVISVSLRDYQLELAERACSGKNTVICAPTGSGKTVVASEIIAKHLAGVKRNHKAMVEQDRKVCFLVTNTSFLEQQAATLRRHLPDCWRISYLCGSLRTDIPVRIIIDCADVVVVTPQIIVNLLLDNKNPDYRDHFSLGVFSLIIFDECHHASLCHPYNEIMKYYHEMKAEGSPVLPQIVGLTASIGIGKTDSFENVINHLLSICARLDCYTISRVRRNLPDLCNYTASVSSEVLLSPASYKKQPFYNKILNLISMFESDFLSKKSEDLKIALEKAGPIPNQKDAQAYELWYRLLRCKLIPQFVKNPEDMVNAMTFLDYIEVFHKALTLCAHFPCEVAWKFLIERLRELKDTSMTAFKNFIEESMVMNMDPNLTKNEMFEDLCALMQNEFEVKLDSRAIVFVKTREIAYRLCEALNSLDKLKSLKVECGLVVGVNSSRGDGGQTISEQRAALEKFSEGRCKIICVTSVAEEGIDIQKCNLVVKYNYVTNEIAHVQRRGRGRAEGSRCILLTNETLLKDKERMNEEKEAMMTKALNFIDSQPTEWFEQKVKALINLYNQKSNREKLIQEKLRTAHRGNLFNVLCRKCARYICRSDQIVTDVHETQFFVIRSDFWALAICTDLVSEKKKKKKVHNSPSIGVHKCGSACCAHPWGRVVFSNRVLLPVLSANAFILEPLFAVETHLPIGPSDSELSLKQRFSFRKWKQVRERCFMPRLMTDYDLAVMALAQEKPTFARL